MSENTSPKEERRGGRAAGTPNKVSSKLRAELADILEVGLEQFMIDIECLKPKERVDAYLTIAKIVIPQQKAIELNDVTPKDQERKFNISFTKKTD